MPTELGIVRGTVTGAVTRYLGIPYGISAGRFHPADAAAGWTGEYDATAFGPSAPQITHGLSPVEGFPEISRPRGPMAEDCFTLNIWVPAVEPSTGPLPVMVWFHGGAFSVGCTDVPIYDGARLAADGGVVVVTVNYRVGALGFCSVPGGSANCGLHDQLLALRWIRDHVGAFGGDPDRVTMFGESAGGGSVLHLLASPDRIGLFRRAIIQSGATFLTLSSSAAADVGAALAAALGRPGAEADELAMVPLDDLLAAQTAVQRDPAVGAAVGAMPFHPCVDASVVPGPPIPALLAGAGAGVDLVVGTTRDEMNLFLDPRAFTPEVVDGITESQMRAPARATLDAHARHHGATFGYEFVWDAPPRPDGRPVGSVHAIDLPFTWGYFDTEWDEFLGTRSPADRTAAEALSAQLRSGWTAFAHSGDPGTELLGTWAAWAGPATLKRIG